MLEALLLLALNIENDLKVTLEATGGQPPFKATLVNASSQTYRVVRPGDGSEVGWREPHVYYSASRWDGSGWQPLTTRKPGRCGLYNPDWRKDVVELKPQGRLDIGTWLPGPEAYFQMESGRYQLVLHYDFAAGKNSKGAPSGRHSDLKPFHLKSRPLEYVVPGR